MITSNNTGRVQTRPCRKGEPLAPQACRGVGSSLVFLLVECMTGTVLVGFGRGGGPVGGAFETGVHQSHVLSACLHGAGKAGCCACPVGGGWWHQAGAGSYHHRVERVHGSGVRARGVPLFLVAVSVNSRAPGSMGLGVVGPSAVVHALGTTGGVDMTRGPGGGRRCTHRPLMVLALANAGGVVGVVQLLDMGYLWELTLKPMWDWESREPALPTRRQQETRMPSPKD